MIWYRTDNRTGRVPLAEVPVVPYPVFMEGVCDMLAGEERHVAEYFAFRDGDLLRFFILLADDASGRILISSHEYAGSGQPASLTAEYPQMHPFEREIAETFGIGFAGNPWPKPLRRSVEEYPFYSIEGESLHEVNVGPIHAGIIEPGAFRFICNGEEVLHLEIALGYQHRGIEDLICSSRSGLRRVCLAESVAGDSAAAHAAAYSMTTERLAERISAVEIEEQRAVALELERMAMHLADIGALCGDVAYQLGQAACEALRTVVINTTQSICGNRFGKGFVRPAGSDLEIGRELAVMITENMSDVSRRCSEVLEDLKNAPSVLARFEECGVLTSAQALEIGAVGLAARASGVERDIRRTHPWGVWNGAIEHRSVVGDQGDVMSRMVLRARETIQSARYVKHILESHDGGSRKRETDTETPFSPGTLAFSLVEGWRGEICHAAVTDNRGRLTCYKIKDPSMHNWMGLALAVRRAGISDFPVCNKSFNLSYCGHDL